MPLPHDLDDQIQELLKEFPQKDRVAVQQALSQKYRGNAQKALGSKEEALLYLITRLPSTYHVGMKVLSILKEVFLGYDKIQSVLDLGAGVGATRWLFQEILPELQTCTLMEQNPFMLGTGKNLHHPLGQFISENYVSAPLKPHDMVFLSYTLSELPQTHQEKTIQKIWDNTTQVLVLIEPGTPHGFETIRRARESLIQKSAYIMAPCGHESPCPMKDGNWCHFSTRVSRSLDHQRAKEGRLSYEDEKFSYLIASRKPSPKPLPLRIIQKPIKAKGHIILDVCTPNGITRKTLTKSKTPDYKTQSRLEWGDGVALGK
jgi:ribosomal protein RSM22 (predicted rRNA methylase)